MHSLLLSLDHFDLYIRGEKSKFLKKRMKYYNYRSEILARDFHRLKISSSPEVKNRIHSILLNLNIPRKKWKNFDPNLSVYDFLLQLARDGHSQVNYLLDLIEEKSRLSKLGLALSGGVVFSLIIYLLTQPAFRFIIEIVQSLLSSVFTIPVGGLVYSLGLSAYYFWRIYNNKRETSFNHWRDSIFQLLTSALNLSGHLVLIISAAVASPVIGGLYVAAASVAVIKEAFCVVQEYFQYLMSPPINESDHLNVHRAYARHVYGFKKRRNALGIDLTAALLLVAITALWCFLPGGIPATIAAYTAIGVVYLIRFALLKWNEERLREQLQDQLAELEGIYTNDSKEWANENEIEISPQREFIHDYSPRTPKTNSSPAPRPLKKQLSSSYPAAKRPFFESKDGKKEIVKLNSEERISYCR